MPLESWWPVRLLKKRNKECQGGPDPWWEEALFALPLLKNLVPISFKDAYSFKELNVLCDPPIWKKSRANSLFTFFPQVYHIFRGTNSNISIITVSVGHSVSGITIAGSRILYLLLASTFNDVEGQDTNCEFEGSFRNSRIIPWNRGWPNPGPRDILEYSAAEMTFLEFTLEDTKPSE